MVNTSDGGGGAQATRLVMTDAAIREARQLYEHLGESCEAIAEEVPNGYSLVTESCGSFFAQIDEGITPFTASWETALMLSADESRLIASNIAEIATHVTDLDRSLTGGMLWATTS